ncbi:hypothetical protein LIER_43008 [Lithospermum erythrorhizon]|uniref:Uncharacterized protein n=1 Tax=Lithospermum erythrorhizon TaxID=34254 RepID=A0AAV3PBT8_LITER
MRTFTGRRPLLVVAPSRLNPTTHKTLPPPHPITQILKTNNVAPPCMVPVSGNCQGHVQFPPIFHDQPPPQKPSDVLIQQPQLPSPKNLNPPPKPHDNSLPQTLAPTHYATTLASAQPIAHKNHPPRLVAALELAPAQRPTIALRPAIAYAAAVLAAIDLALAPSPAHDLGTAPSGPCAASTSTHLPAHGPAAHVLALAACPNLIHAAQPPYTWTSSHNMHL